MQDFFHQQYAPHLGPVPTCLENPPCTHDILTWYKFWWYQIYQIYQMSAPKGLQKNAYRVSYFENDVTVRGWWTIIVSLSRRLYIYDYITLCGYIFAYARKCVVISKWVRGFRRSCNFMTRPFVLGHVYMVHCRVHHVIHLDLHQDAWIKQTFVPSIICFVIHTGTYWAQTYKHKCIHTYTNTIKYKYSCHVKSS